MNTKGLANNYGTLTPEERYRLMLAAATRDDEVEHERLKKSASEIHLTICDFAPYASALHELSLLIFIELIDDANQYFDAIARYDECQDWFGEESEDGDPVQVQRHRDIAMASGFLLRTKANGWKRFCEQMNIPHEQLWNFLPGQERLQQALSEAEKSAFSAEEMLCWLNHGVRTPDKPELTEVPRSVAGVAASTEKMFREMVSWWGG